jgi:hypothetical protein
MSIKLQYLLGYAWGLSNCCAVETFIWTSGDLLVHLSHAPPLGIIHFWHSIYLNFFFSLIISSPHFGISSACSHFLVQFSTHCLSEGVDFFKDFLHHLAKNSISLPLLPNSCSVLYGSSMLSWAHSMGCLPALFMVVLPFSQRKS